MLFNACTASHIVDYPCIGFVTAWERARSLHKETGELACKTAKRKSAISGCGLWPLLSTEVCGDSSFEGGSSSALQIRGTIYWDTFLWLRLNSKQVKLPEWMRRTLMRLGSPSIFSHFTCWLIWLGVLNSFVSVLSKHWHVAVGATLSTSNGPSLYFLKNALWCRAVLALCLRVLPVKHLLWCSLTWRQTGLKIKLLLNQQVSVYKIKNPP